MKVEEADMKVSATCRKEEREAKRREAKEKKVGPSIVRTHPSLRTRRMGHPQVQRAEV